jgi:hypothetical protein
MLADERTETGKSIEEVAADFVKKHRGSSIIQHAASVEEVANLVTYLASPWASATIGASRRVEGGVIDPLWYALLTEPLRCLSRRLSEQSIAAVDYSSRPALTLFRPGQGP